MKFQYLGTAAAEAFPSLFCGCERCRRAREIGGRALRTRSQAIIDGRLLIDFPADTLSHLHTHALDPMKIKNCLITHSHSDHLYHKELTMIRPGMARPDPGFCFTLWGSEIVTESMRPFTERYEAMGLLARRTVRCFEPFTVDGYTVTALPAVHDPSAGPVIYQISDGKHTILYGNDTNYPGEEVWSYWAETKPYFSFVSLDCTAGNRYSERGLGPSHMSFGNNVEVKVRMLEEGYADAKTIFISNHFSHNGTDVVYDDFVPIAAAEGFGVSYDGMKITLE